MNRVLAGIVTGGTLIGGSGVVRAVDRAQAPLPPAVEAHIAAAKAAAGTEHAGLFAAACDTARDVIAQAARGEGPNPPRTTVDPVPPRERWHVEPVKVFDNLYYVGQRNVSAWALTTSDGIILLDAIWDYSVEDEVVGGLKKLGLDPARIKYVVVTHGHGDHAGGAKLLQERYGSRLVMSAADYDWVEQSNLPWKPRRDIVATDGYALTLGDTTVTLYITPGHTEGHAVADLHGAGRRDAPHGGVLGRHVVQLRPDQAEARGVCRRDGAFQTSGGRSQGRHHPVQSHRLRRQHHEAARGAGPQTRRSRIPMSLGPRRWRIS